MQVRMRVISIVVGLVLAGGVSAATPSGGAGQVLAADTPSVTLDGNGFIAPAGWSLTATGPMRLLEAPERGSKLALIDVGSVADADAAVAAAWAIYATTPPPLKLDSDRARRDGWEQIRSYAYRSPAGQSRVVSAQALRVGQRWTVAILDMDDGVFGKRESQVDLALGRLWPKGYAPETFAGKQAHALDPARIDILTRFIEGARVAFDVPGVAIGIVQHGKVVFAGGFGVRELGKPGKVDASTVFMIASNNKALTTLMLAKQVDAGRFAWDTPVTTLMPEFRLGDAATTARVQMRHLVCACTGMPRQDMEMLFDETLTPNKVVRVLATMQPTSSFGELYQYSNAMAAAGGFTGGHVRYPKLELGTAYDRAMQDLVFDPLDMRSTTFDFDRALRSNHASPHARDVHGRLVPLDLRVHRDRVRPSRPDGGAWSNVDDMLRYVRMELADGLLPDGSRYIGEAALHERARQQVATGNDTGYGMGLKLDRSLGTLVVNHGGSEPGYRSDMFWLPEHDVGGVILTNADAGTGMRYPFRRRVLELLFDGRPLAEENVAVQSRRVRQGDEVARKALTVPVDPAVAGTLATRYRNPALGDIVVSRRGTALWFDFGGWDSEMATRNDVDTPLLVTVSPGVEGFGFKVQGTAGQPTLVLDDEQHEYVFTPVQ